MNYKNPEPVLGSRENLFTIACSFCHRHYTVAIANQAPMYKPSCCAFCGSIEGVTIELYETRRQTA